jgi:hypothetical protein
MLVSSCWLGSCPCLSLLPCNLGLKSTSFSSCSLCFPHIQYRSGSFLAWGWQWRLSLCVCSLSCLSCWRQVFQCSVALLCLTHSTAISNSCSTSYCTYRFVRPLRGVQLAFNISRTFQVLYDHIQHVVDKQFFLSSRKRSRQGYILAEGELGGSSASNCIAQIPHPKSHALRCKWPPQAGVGHWKESNVSREGGGHVAAHCYASSCCEVQQEQAPLSVVGSHTSQWQRKQVYTTTLVFKKLVGACNPQKLASR